VDHQVREWLHNIEIRRCICTNTRVLRKQEIYNYKSLQQSLAYGTPAENYHA
jgi:hypothetical protein